MANLPKAKIEMDEEERTLCELAKRKPLEMIASELEVKVESIYQRFYRLRNRIESAQHLVNESNNLKKSSARLRKLLTKGGIPQ